VATVAIVDYGGSNLRSVAAALEHLGGRDHRVVVADDPATIDRAARVVFPGQGAIGDCMRRLRAGHLDEAIHRAIAGRPFLGICLGLQTLFSDSAEDGGTTGLGIYAGSVERFAAGLTDPATGAHLKVPHMGWNTVEPEKPHPLWAGIGAGTRFYFVHSYYVRPADPGLAAARSRYGVDFTCAVAADNVFATQFHPEKSQRPGLTLLDNFLRWQGDV
jgi:glutamine amidotransferase